MKYQAVAVTKTRMFFTDHRTGEETVPATQKKVRRRSVCYTRRSVIK